MAITLTPLATGFNNPIGIDYHRPTDSLVMSINYPTGHPYNFELVAQNGNHTQFSTINGLSDEVKIATARDSLGGFIPGELFVGTGVQGEVARVSQDGKSVSTQQLSGETGLLRGSLHVDRTGVFAGDLIVVTTEGGVWRVPSVGSATRLTQLDPPTHLEGVVTVPEDAKYGPWAGKILAGAEAQGRIYSIDPFGNTTAEALVDEDGVAIRPEDIEIIPANANFFGVDFLGKTLQFAPASEFAGMVGDVLIATEGPPGVLWRVYWDGMRFQTERLAQVEQWEHVTFAPVELDPPRRMFEYVAKVVCGIQSDPRDMRLTPGAYATTINIHNPNDGEVRFIKKKLALTFPPEEQKAGEVFDSIGKGPHVLKPDQALAVDCMDIREELFKEDGFPGGSGYIEGFVVIQSPASLDVTAVYTSAALDEAGQPTGHSSIDVEQVRERQKEGSILGGQRTEQAREL